MAISCSQESDSCLNQGSGLLFGKHVSAVSAGPFKSVAFDGANLWVTNETSNTVSKL
jgi:hypothetical protein